MIDILLKLIEDLEKEGYEFRDRGISLKEKHPDLWNFNIGVYQGLISAVDKVQDIIEELEKEN